MTEHAIRDSGEPGATLEEIKAEQELLQEKAERKRLESFWWAAVLIWAGLIFVADNLEILPEINEAGAWSWIFLGAGLLGLLGALYRTSSPQILNPTGWDYFWSAFFLIVGASGFLGSWVVFPLALIALGVAILASVLFRAD